MNQDKTKPTYKPRLDAPAQKPRPASPPPSNKAAPAPTPSEKIEIDLAYLSRSLARDLKFFTQEEWCRIESVPCRVGFTRDMAEGIRFVDAVANVVNQAGGLFATQNIDRRRDLEKCSQEIVDAFRTIIVATVQVARKLNLTNILNRHWRFLSVYGPAPKTDRAKTATKPAATQQEKVAAKVA